MEGGGALLWWTRKYRVWCLVVGKVFVKSDVCVTVHSLIQL